MIDSDPPTTKADILAVFDELDDPCGPLATSESADKVDCSHRTAYTKLDAPAESGEIAWNRIGDQARSWWRPVATSNQNPPSPPLDDSSTPH